MFLMIFLFVQVAKEINEKICDNRQPIPEKTLPRHDSNEIHIFKAKAVTPKSSKNILEEFPKIIDDVSIAVDGFGMITTDKKTEVVKRFTFANKSKMQGTLLDFHQLHL